MSEKMMEQIKGHNKIKAQLNQALAKNRLPHALLFSGPSGVGKGKMAWALAQSLLCEQEEACGKCHSCLSVSKQRSENILCVIHETLKIRLQDVRAIPPFLSLQSFARAKVVLMDFAEKLNLQAGNFLLKIIEEPPPKSFFFLISSEPSKLSLTLRSRIQNLRFQALPEKLVRELAPEGALEWMIRGSRGRMDLIEELSEKQKIRDQAFNLWSKIFKSSFSSLDFPGVLGNRKEALMICRFWQEILRDARFFKSGCFDQLIHGDQKKDIERLSHFSHEFLDILIKETLEMEADLQANADYSLCFENFVCRNQKALTHLSKV